MLPMPVLGRNTGLLSWPRVRKSWSVSRALRTWRVVMYVAVFIRVVCSDPSQHRRADRFIAPHVVPAAATGIADGTDAQPAIPSATGQNHQARVIQTRTRLKRRLRQSNTGPSLVFIQACEDERRSGIAVSQEPSHGCAIVALLHRGGIRQDHAASDSS